jgi:hypothetical protein
MMEIAELVLWCLFESMVGGFVLAIGIGAAFASLVAYIGFPSAAPYVLVGVSLPLWSAILFRQLRKNAKRRSG